MALQLILAYHCYRRQRSVRVCRSNQSRCHSRRPSRRWNLSDPVAIQVFCVWFGSWLMSALNPTYEQARTKANEPALEEALCFCCVKKTPASKVWHVWLQAIVDEEVRERNEFLQWNLQDCRQKPEVLCKAWAIRYSDCKRLDVSLPDIAGRENTTMIIELHAHDDGARKCVHGCCYVHGKVVTWNVATNTDIAPEEYQAVQQWIDTRGRRIDFLLCDEKGCDGFVFPGQPLETGAVNVFKSTEEDLRVWSLLSKTFPAVSLPHEPTTSLDYCTRYQHRDGSQAFRPDSKKGRDEWAAEGKGRHQQKSRRNFVSPVQYQACWWIVSWLWEVIDAFYDDDRKVPPLANKAKKPLPRERFCKKFAVRFGDPRANRLRSLTVSCTRVLDPVQLTCDLADFLRQIMVSENNADVMGYNGLYYRSFGNLEDFCAPVAQKVTAFLPHTRLLGCPAETPVAPVAGVWSWSKSPAWLARNLLLIQTFVLGRHWPNVGGWWPWQRQSLCKNEATARQLSYLQ